MTHTILRLPDIKTSTGLSRSTIYLRIAQRVFTKPVSLGGRAVGWPANEVSGSECCPHFREIGLRDSRSGGEAGSRS